MNLTPAASQFVDRVATVLEGMGIGRSCGRMFGVLMIAPRPLSLDELGATLHLSKASVCANARLYERLQLLQRVNVPGDRKHYYEILPGAFERTAEARVAAIQHVMQLTKTGLEVIGADNDSAHERLQEMYNFYAHIAAAMEAAIAQWKTRKDGR